MRGAALDSLEDFKWPLEGEHRDGSLQRDARRDDARQWNRKGKGKKGCLGASLTRAASVSYITEDQRPDFSVLLNTIRGD